MSNFYGNEKSIIHTFLCIIWIGFAILFFPNNCFSQAFIQGSNNLGVNFSADGFYGNGLSCYDWDGDGWDDLVLLRSDEAPRFYKNVEGFMHEIEIPSLNFVMEFLSVNWIDINNDGNIDISFFGKNSSLRIFINEGDFSFHEITSTCGISLAPTRGSGHAWGDINKDGLPDLYACNYENPNMINAAGNFLYLNNGDLTFTDITEISGTGDGFKASFQPVFLDYNKDGWQDIFVINDRASFANSLYKNIDGTHFEDVSQTAGVNFSIDAMSATVGDYDNDGDLDIYISNNTDGNLLHRNNANGTFTNVAPFLSLQIFQFCWGAIWIDYDGDMLQDLFVGTSPTAGNYNLFLFQNHNSSFDLNLQSGFGQSQNVSYAAGRADFNRDGKPDIVTLGNDTFATRLWLNNAESTNFIKLKLQGVQSSWNGLGSWIELYTSDTVQYRYIMNSEQYLSQNSQWQFFSLKNNSFADSIIVKWLNGTIDKFYNTPANEHYTILEGSSNYTGIELISNPIICPGDSILLDAGTWDFYNWSNGSNLSYISIHQSGMYEVTVRNDDWPPIYMRIEVDIPEAIELQYTLIPPSCFGAQDGTIELHNFVCDSFFLNGNQITGSTISAGLLSINCQDENGCPSFFEFMIDEPANLSLNVNIFLSDSCNETWTAIAEHSGGTGENTVSWSIQLPESPGYTFLGLGSSICFSAPGGSILQCTVEDENQCVQQLEYPVEFATSEKVLSTHDLTIYPNPIDSHLKLRYNGVVHSWKIFDLSGRSFRRGNFVDDYTISCTFLDKGIYVLHIITADRAIKRIFVKR